MKFFRPVLCLALCATFAASPACAAANTPNKGIESAGTIIAIAMPLAADGISLLHHNDWDGVAELTEASLVTGGIALLLKQVVKERRPDGSNFQSFPSDTAALAFAPANYLWDRYGWSYGVPAYAAAIFVGYSRVASKQHHWYDVAASAAIAFGANYAFVTPFDDDRYRFYASADPDSVGVHFVMRW
jgi:membrane-associated phospholipid phosphatase